MKTRMISVMCVFLLAMFFSSITNAQNLLNYEFGWSNDSSVAPNFTAENLAGLSLTRGPGVNSNLAVVPGAFGAGNWATPSLPDLTNKYLSFGFEVDPLYYAELSMISFRGESNNEGPRDFAIRSSLDNFGSNLHTFQTLGDGGPNLHVANVSFDASVLGPVMGEVEFRIYQTSLNSPTASTTSAGWFRIRGPGGGSGFSVGGDITAIPEPGSLMVLGGLSLVALLRRRR